MLGGALLPLLPWAFYISQDPKSFLVQFGGTACQESLAGQPLTSRRVWRRGVAMNISQYGLPLGFLAAADLGRRTGRHLLTPLAKP